MTALTAPVRRRVKNIKGRSYESYAVATSAVIFQGALCCIDTNDRIRPASKTDARRFVGMAESSATGVTDGSVRCTVSWGYDVRIAAAATLTGDFVTASVVIEDDNTVVDDGSVTATLSVVVGEVVSNDTAGFVWVRLRPGNFTSHAVAV